MENNKHLYNYRLPPVSLLRAYPKPADDPNLDKKLKEKAKQLEDALKSFGIDGTVVDIIHGNVITRFDMTFAPGTKVSSVIKLHNELLIGLALLSLRIDACGPDKSILGFEIPNEVVHPIYMRELVESECFSNSSPLTVALGRDIFGAPIYCDISKKAHILIGGTTGSGKSICINSMLTSILMHSSPYDVRMILVDPTVIDLSVYNDIPHLLTPVITDPSKAIDAFDWAISEVDRRLKIFEEAHTNNIAEYNRKHFGSEKHLPLVLIVVDELAAIMELAAKEFESRISALSLKASEAGIHMILATQKVTVPVLTSVIKNNILTRIAFEVISGISSKIILDETGAEQLLGRGDMLYSPMNAPSPIRAQCVYISDKEVENIIEYINKNNIAMYDKDVLKAIDRKVVETASNTKKTTENEALYNRAVELVIISGSASVSMLQRSLKIGYSQAARLIDELENEKIIGSFEGSAPRKVLVTEQEWLDAKSADIESIVGRYVSLFRQGDYLWGICPFHEEKTPSFAVMPKKKIFKCFGCGKTGNAIKFIMEKEHLNYADAIRRIVELGESDKTE